MNKNSGKGKRVIVLGVVFYLRLQGWKHPMMQKVRAASSMYECSKKEKHLTWTKKRSVWLKCCELKRKLI